MAEGAPLLREYVGKTCIEGSNPSGSARMLGKTGLRGPFAFPTLDRPPFKLPISLLLKRRLGSGSPCLRFSTRSRGPACGVDAVAYALYQRSRVSRAARIVQSGRELPRIFHAKGVERLVRNDLRKGRSQERFYGALEWLYGWKVENCQAD